MSTHIAALPMYDLPEVATATDALWRVIAARLRASGTADVPADLTRALPHRDTWRHPGLLLGQSCGWPCMTEFRDTLRIVAAPVYDAPGCVGANHRSFIVVASDAPAQRLADLKGSRFAVNAADSNTGMNLPRHAVAPLAGGGRFFAEIVTTGSHAASLALVAARTVDAAAIDCVTHALLARHRPAEVARTRILAETAPSPTLPFVTAAGTDDRTLAALCQALADAMRDPALAPCRRALFLAGLAPAAPRDYEILLDYAAAATRLGYPVLA